MSERLWRSQDGRELRVGEMDENHLLSAIAMVERENDWRKIWLPRLYMEMAARRCMVPPRMPVSAAEVASRVRTKIGVLQQEVEVRRVLEENIRGWVEKLVSEQVERALGSLKSTKRGARLQSKRPKAKGSRTPRGTLSSGTSSSRRTKAPSRRHGK